MSLWTLNRPPAFKNPKGKPLVATERGWEDPDTGEVLVAIGELTTKAGAADVLVCEFVEAEYLQGDELAVRVRFNERVDVTAGAAIEVSWSGLSGNFFLNAVAQSDNHEIIFDKQSDNTTPEVVPSEAGVLSIAAQSLSGTIKDAGTLVTSNAGVSADAAAFAGTRVVPLVELTDVEFDQLSYVQLAPINVVVTWATPVSVGAGATLEVDWDGLSGPFLLTCTGTSSLASASFAGTVPAEAGTLSIGAQDIVGTVTDGELHISTALADAAGERVVA